VRQHRARQDMIQNTHSTDQPAAERTDIWRTATGPHVLTDRESAGQRPFRWAGMKGL